MADRLQILEYCDSRLDAGAYSDIAMNGLQVEGADRIERLALAVSASARTISAAAEWEADVLLVHHGLFWGASPRPLTGLLGRRLKTLFQNDINLIGYHLPLDGHADIGNNALLAHELGLSGVGRFAEVGGAPLGVIAEAFSPLSRGELLGRIASTLEREPVVVGDQGARNRIARIGVLSGSGYGTLAEAAEAGCEALITGDIREPTMAEARELGIIAIAAGHEATERFGIQALGRELAQRFQLEVTYFADPNPI